MRGSCEGAYWGRIALPKRAVLTLMMIVSPVTRSRTVTSACRASLERQSGLEHLDCIEGEFGIEAALDVGALAKPVLLAREQKIADRIAFAPERLDHGFGLVWRHDCVFVALKEDDGLRQPLYVGERRAFAIALFFLRIGSNEPIEIARFELVGIARERSRVAHAVVACAALEEIPKHERRKRRVASGAAAGNDDALVVDGALAGQEFRAVDAVIDVDDAPVSIEPLPIGAAETGTAAVIDIEHRNPAARPELRAEVERA